MSPRYDEFRSGRGTDRQLYVPADDFQPTILRSHSFVSAYLRFVVSLFVLAGLYTLVALELTEMIPTPEEVFYQPGQVGESVPVSVHYSAQPWTDLPMVEAGDGLLWGYLHVLEWLFSWGLVAGTVVVAGVVALALERTVGS